MRKFWSVIIFMFPLHVMAVLPEINFPPQTEVYKEGETAIITAELSAPSTEPVYVRLNVEFMSSATFRDTDMDLDEAVIKISPGQTRGSITFRVLDDGVEETDEIFSLIMTAPLNATLGVNSALSLVFMDNHDSTETLPEINFEASTSQITEGQTLQIKAKLSEPATSIVIVPISVCGTATYPYDHDLYTNELIFFPGNTEAILAVNVYEDFDSTEIDEDIIVTMLSPISNAKVGSIYEHTVTISNAQLH